MGTLTLRTETLWIPGTLTTRILIRPKELKHFASRSGAAELKHFTTARRGVVELKHYATTGSRGLSLHGSWRGAAELSHFTSARKGGRRTLTLHIGIMGRRGTQALRNDWIPGTLTTRILNWHSCLPWNSHTSQRQSPC